MLEALRDIIDEVILALGPLVDSAHDPEELIDILADLGWTPSSVPRPLVELAAAGKDLVSMIGTDLEGIPLDKAFTSVKQLVDAIHAISAKPEDAFPNGIDISSFKTSIGRDLLDYVLVEHALRNSYPIGGLLKLAGIIRLVKTPATGLRQSYLKREVVWNRIGDLLTDPAKGFREVFDWNSASPQLTQALGDFASLLESYGLQFSYFEPTGDLLSFVNANATVPLDAPLGIDLAFDDALGAPDGFAAGVRLLVRSPTASRGSAISFLPYVSLSGTQGIALSDTTLLSIRSKVDFTKGVALTLSPEQSPEVQTGFLGGTASSSDEFQVGLKITPPSDQPERCLLGTPGASRFAIRTVGVFIGSQALSLDELDIFVVIELDKATLVIRAGDGDGFLQKILPKDGIHLDFDLVVGWSNKRGLYFKGGAGLEATLPVNIDLFGVIKIDSVYLALQEKEDTEAKGSAIRAAAATTVQVKLGPVSAVVEQFGLQAMLSFPEKGGNLGVANLDLGFKPPNGVGLSIKAQVVTGSGYLYFDFEKEQYVGMLQLEIAKKISVSAVGLLTTRMPDGSKGFSLLVIISARFEPGIQLGYGFSLTGLGGLLGVNRTVAVEVLRDGLRRGALGSILFPQHIVENATQIVSNLSTIFPPAQDRFLFGPMAIIGWGGSPPILTLELGIILELPEPVRLMILGRVRVLLQNKKDDAKDGAGEKKEQVPKLKLQLDALGVIDFGSGDISLDAVLYDSTIGPFAVTGQMALRANFGAQPMFLLSVGGFHPAFQAPAGFPSVERVALTLAKKDKDVEVRLQMSAYFALTSNTIQFGSHLDLYAHLGIFEVIGVLGFDALFQFPPLGLTASFEAMVVVKANGVVLMGIHLQVNLTGPSPWHVWGKAQVTFLFIRVTAEFDVTVGREVSPSLPPPIHVHDLLVVELQNPANWSSQLPAGENPLVTFRSERVAALDVTKPPSHMVLVHSSAELQVNQRLVPLVGAKEPISLFGNTTPEGPTTFELGVQANELGMSAESVSDWFARAQFYDMSDTEKLSSKSFDQMPSGMRFKAPVGYHCGTPVPKDMSAATRPNDKTLSPGGAPLAETKLTAPLPSDTVLRRAAAWGAAGSAPIRHSGSAKYLDPARRQQGITLKPTTYRVVGNQLGAMLPNMGPLGSELSGAAAHVLARRASGKFPGTRWGIVPDLGPEGTEG